VTAPRRTANGWTRGRITAYAVGSVLAPALLAFTLHTFTRRDEPPTPEVLAPRPSATPSAAASASATAHASATASASASIAPEAPPSAIPSAIPSAVPSAAATAIDGQDAAAWRKVLRAAAATSSWKKGATAIFALVELDPPAFSEGPITEAAADVAASLEIVDSVEAGRLFDVLSRTPPGLDVLYQLVSKRGGTKSAQRAADLLKTPEVRARALPALDVLLKLRDAACPDKEALLERAGAEGDQRTLAFLVTLRSADCNPQVTGCCMRGNEKLEGAMQKLLVRYPQPVRERAPAEADPYQ
jgi:hypothetical protein